MKPFLKWAGGKTQLIPTILEELPTNIDNLTTYVEPFIGAGAVFINFLENNSFDKYIINDVNVRLINVYKVIRDDISVLINSLTEIRDKYLSLSVENDERKEMYYEIRDKFNSKDISKIDSATYFIFLNKTCFNGLYRENLKGGFNVPIGSYENNPDMFEEQELRELSRKLNERNEKDEFRVIILNESYEKLEQYIDENTFVYFDPPYRPVTKGGFNAYDKSGFNDDSQKKLALFFEKVSQKGAKLMLSNSDPRNLDKEDEFFDIIYKNFNIKRIFANRSINSRGSARGDISELLIMNYGEEINMETKGFSTVYSEQLGFENRDEIFEALVNEVKSTIKGWDYFVNWEKAVGNMRKLEQSLNLMNCLIGKKDVKNEARELMKDYPEVINTFPILVATRDKDFKILEATEEDLMNFKEFDFSKKWGKKDDVSSEEIEKYVEFLEKTNLLKLFADKTIKSLVDYVLGVEVGLDSNARKNRTGTAMEDIVEVLVKKLCEENNWEYKTQATVKEIENVWGIIVPTDKSQRRYDFAINNNGKLLLAEVNYYSGGGSKLKTVANEFTKLDKYIEEGGFQFCWITDGLGWNTAKKPLRDAFDNMRQIFNLEMIEQGALEYLVKNL